MTSCVCKGTVAHSLFRVASRSVDGPSASRKGIRMRHRNKNTSLPFIAYARNGDVDRRESFWLALVLASAGLFRTRGARASLDMDPSELPRDFVDLAYDLIDALRDSIDADLSGAPEREVRRKADPAKDLVKRYINTWSGASAIADATPCKEIRFAVQELGEFYRTNGQRQRMTDDVAKSILQHLEIAEDALPEKREKSIFPF